MVRFALKCVIPSLIVLLVSCAAPSISRNEAARIDFGNHPEDLLSEIRSVFNNTLIDPDSVTQLSYEKVKRCTYWSNPGWCVMVHFNAKNRLGGYVGRRTHFAFMGKDGEKRLINFNTIGEILHATRSIRFVEGEDKDDTPEQPTENKNIINQENITKLKEEDSWNQINSFKGSGAKTTKLFEIPSKQWRVRWLKKSTNQDITTFVNIFIHKENGDLVTATQATKDGSDICYVHVGNQKFYLEIVSMYAEWKILVEIPTKNLLGQDTKFESLEILKEGQPWIGVSLINVPSEVAMAIGIPEGKGAFVKEVDENGTAFKAGIRKGDIILKFDSTEIRSNKDLARLIFNKKVGDEAFLIVINKGKEKTIICKIGKYEKPSKQSL